MCPLTKEPCSSECQWYTKVFTGRDGKDYYGCILEAIEMHLHAISVNTDN